MKLSDLPPDFTPERFMQLDKDSLDQIPYDRKKWLCQCKKCSNGTHVRDYGLSPWFFLDRNSKNSRLHPQDYWRNLNDRMMLCGKHWDMFNRLVKIYGEQHTASKLLDYSKTPLEKLIPVGSFNVVKQVEGDDL